MTVNFQTESGGYRLRSYRLVPKNGALPGELADRLRSLAQAMIVSSLPRRNPHQDKQGRLAWTLDNNRMEMWY